MHFSPASACICQPSYLVWHNQPSAHKSDHGVLHGGSATVPIDLKLLPWYSLSCPVQLCLVFHSPANPLPDKAVQPLRMSLQLSLLLLAMLLHHRLLFLTPLKVNFSCMCLHVACDEQWTQTWITNCVNKNCIYWCLCISTVNYLWIFHAREE